MRSPTSSKREVGKGGPSPSVSELETCGGRVSAPPLHSDTHSCLPDAGRRGGERQVDGWAAVNPNPDPRHPEACDTTRAGRLTAGGETRPQGPQKRCIRLCTQGLRY